MAAPPLSQSTNSPADDTPLPTMVSINPAIFKEPVPLDYICSVCKKVPLNPISPGCCGVVHCEPCLKSLFEMDSKICKYCEAPCQSELTSPFIALKIGGLSIGCIYFSDTKDDITSAITSAIAITTGCKWSGMVGKYGRTLSTHLKKDCQFHLLPCPGCKKPIQRRLMSEHRGPVTAPSDCQHKVVQCVVCNEPVRGSDVKIHEETVSHQRNRETNMLMRVAALERELTSNSCKINNLIDELQATKLSLHQTRLYYESRLSAESTRFEARMIQLQNNIHARFVHMECKNWSTIHVKSETEPTGIYSMRSPLYAWSHQWWIKVEKAMDGHIGLYLCCHPNITNHDQAETKVIETDKFPLVTVDYQLMVRRRGSDDAACMSTVMRTQFGQQRAWGVPRFITLEKLKAEGAYSASEDTIMFGIVILPRQGLRWGIPTFTGSSSPLVPPHPPPSPLPSTPPSAAPSATHTTI